ncbi:hypothetical protein D9M70_612890 [compost metagenome]
MVDLPMLALLLTSTQLLPTFCCSLPSTGRLSMRIDSALLPESASLTLKSLHLKV